MYAEKLEHENTFHQISQMYQLMTAPTTNYNGTMAREMHAAAKTTQTPPPPPTSHNLTNETRINPRRFVVFKIQIFVLSIHFACTLCVRHLIVLQKYHKCPKCLAWPEHSVAKRFAVMVLMLPRLLLVMTAAVIVTMLPEVVVIVLSRWWLRCEQYT